MSKKFVISPPLMAVEENGPLTLTLDTRASPAVLGCYRFAFQEIYHNVIPHAAKGTSICTPSSNSKSDLSRSFL